MIARSHPALSRFSVAFLLAAAAACEPGPPASGAPGDEVVVLTGARLIDGTGAEPVDDAVLVLRGGRVEAAGRAGAVDVPAEARRVELPGRTIIPGIVNAHGHAGMSRGLASGPEHYTRENLLDQLSLYARYGVTTVISLGDDGPEGVALRREQDTAALDRARLFVAGPVLSPSSPQEAHRQVAELRALGVDWVKIRVDDGLGQRRKMPPEIHRAVIAAADENGLPLAAHIVELEDAKAVLRNGARLLAHSVRDRPVDDELIALMRERDVCITPTLTRELSTFVYAGRPGFFDDPFFLREADPGVLRELEDPERQARVRASASAAFFEEALPLAKSNMRSLADAGVGIALGTDSGPPGRFQGYFEHLEMEMMADAGMSPMEILVAATGDAARCTGLAGEVGTLEAGAWADLVVLGADPLDDIRHTRTIESVWIAGAPLER